MNAGEQRALLRPLLMGHLLNWLLTGVLSVQVYMYHTSFPKDSKGTKALAYGVYLIEVVQTAFTAETAIHVFADNFGDLTVLNQIGTIWLAVPLMSALPAFISQTFYAYRVRILSQSKVLPLGIFLLSVVQLVSATLVTVLAFRAMVISDIFTARTIMVNTICNASSALCDILIAAAMTYYLSQGSSGIRQTNNLLSKLIRLIIGTGSLTAIIAIMNLILLVVASGREFFFVITGGILGKLYSNSILVVLNSRSRPAPDESVDLVVSNGSLHVSGSGSSHRQVRTRISQRDSVRDSIAQVMLPPIDISLSSVESESNKSRVV
ncbi:hypothetical protein BDZ97DRAFT_1708653 [Flammula alnicola]|nr:hypothetical protein BDZ97DRAFT_1708653 [Flammula alnicola]